MGQGARRFARRAMHCWNTPDSSANGVPHGRQQALLLKLLHPLLQAGNAPTDARRDALWGAADAAEQPHTGAAPYGGNHAKGKGETPMPDKQLLRLLGEGQTIYLPRRFVDAHRLFVQHLLFTACLVLWASAALCRCQGVPSTRFLSGLGAVCAAVRFLPPVPRRCGGQAGAQREEKACGHSCTQSSCVLACGDEKP